MPARTRSSATALGAGVTLYALVACGDAAPDDPVDAGASRPVAARPADVAPTTDEAARDASAGAGRAAQAPTASSTSGVPSIPFTDVTAASGIAFVHENGARGSKLLPETMGGGCAFLDADRDGDVDLLLVNGRPWPDAPEAQTSDAHTTYLRNDGRGAFVEASREAGLDLRVQGMGAAVGDADGDGDDDLFVTALGHDVHLRNDGTGRFDDATTAAGTGGASDAWSTAACFVDVDRDGDLDLFVGHYVAWTPERDLALERTLEGIAGRAYLPPMSFDGTQPSLFRNDGRGAFADVSLEAGLHVVDEQGRAVAKTLAVLPFDADDDGDVDLFVANDTTRNFLYANRGDGVFDETGVDAGLAYDRLGQPTGAMGVDLGDLRGDGGTTLVVGNFSDEMTSAYVAVPGGGFFTDETVALGLGAPTRWALTFGLLLFDADLDGRLDLLAANGHLEESIADAQPGQSYAQAPQLFWNTGAAKGPLLALADDVGDLARPIVGRGLAAADVDGDGDLDVLLTQPGGPARLLRNDQRTGHAWLAVDLRGSGEQPVVDGARVAVTSGGRTQVRDVRSCRSYLSAVPSTLVFGLGLASAIDALVVTWPDGSVQDVPPPAPRRKVAVTKDTERPDPTALLNAAKALLENGDASGARVKLEQALALRPESAPILRNLARAKLLAADPDGALEVLARARAADPESTAAVYLTGVALARASRYDEAVPFLEDAARRDPLTAAVRFQLGNAYELVDRSDDALVQYGEAARLDPAHSAAQFRLALAARKRGDTAGYRDRNREFLRLKQLYGDAYQTPVSLERCVHTLAEAGDARDDADATWPSIEVTFADATEAWIGARRAAALAASSADDAGRLAFVAVSDDGALVELRAADDGRLVERALAARAPSGARELAVGNLHDSPRVLGKDELPVRRADLVVATSDGLSLLERDESGDFADASARAGLDGLRATRVALADADHDGDLDLLAAGEDGLLLLLAAGDGTLVDGSEASGIPALGACVDVAAADLDGNGAVDLVVARGDGSPTVVVENRRAGRFARQPEPPGPLPAARRVLLEHLDADDDPDVLLVAQDAVHVRRARGTARQTVALDLDPRGATILDHDADGRADLLVVGVRDGRGALVLLRNAGDGTLGDATSACGLDALALAPLADALAADVDRDGDDDVLLRAADGTLHALRNDGGSANGQLALRLFSLVNTSGGIGTRVQVRAGDFVATRLASAEQPVTIGLGGREALDSVQTLWPNGIVDNRLDVVPGARPLDVVILEQVDTGSCPFLFVWDGTRFRFVNDMIGSGAVGLPLTRQVMCPVNPSEIVEVGPDDLLVAVDGRYEVRVTSELREAAYYDHVALLAVDHLPGLEAHSTDRLRGPPFPASEPWLLADPRGPRSAVGDDGVDRTAAVAALDGEFAPPGPVRPAPLRGVCEPMTIELDFGPLPRDDDELVLALTGWIEYGTASSQIALAQRPDVPTIWPTLEARASDGSWTPLDVVVGLPAGKVKTLLVELGGLLPDGCDRLRLTTTFQLSWDRIALGRRAPLDAAFVHSAGPARAELRWRGHSDLRVRAPLHPKTPDYDSTTDVPPWRTSLEGWCTRYGDVLPLLDEVDGKVVVLNGGDELVLSLPADAFPPVPAGLERTWMWWSHGWNKEGDPNTEGGDSIWPLPLDHSFGRTPEEDDAWRLMYNTRWVPADRFRRATPGTR